MTEEGQPWGHPDRYYGKSEDGSRRGALQHSNAESLLRQVFRSGQGAYRTEVVRTFKQWNSAVREQLRTEMGFRLSDGKTQLQIPVRVEDGIPLPLARLLDTYSEEALKLILNLSKLEGAHAGLQFIEDEYDAMVSLLHGQQVASITGVRSVGDFVAQLLDVLRKLRIYEAMREIREDILGAYLFYQGHVSLYWMPIALFSQMMGVTIQGLTVAVLIHELAHAYSHIGFDIDKGQWDTGAFAKTDDRVVEGIAQHYTATISRKLSDRFSMARDAYKRLLEFQSEPYRVHLKWEEEGLSAGEVVRAAMVQCRITGTTAYDGYVDLLEQYRHRLTGRAAGQLF